MSPRTRYLSVYEDPGWWCAVAAEQSVSSTSDLMSQESPFYSLTGTKPPL